MGSSARNTAAYVGAGILPALQPPPAPVPAPPKLPASIAFNLVKRQHSIRPDAGHSAFWEPDFSQAYDIANLTGVQGSVHATNLDGTLTLDALNGNNNIITLVAPKPQVPWVFGETEIVWPTDFVNTEWLRKGIWKDVNNYVCVSFDRKNGNVFNKVRVNSVDMPAVVQAVDFSKYTKLGFMLMGTWLIAYGGNGKGITIFKAWDLTAYVNFRNTSMAGWSYVFWGANDSPATLPVLSKMKWGPAGALGMRDHNFVTYENGEPYWDQQGNLYFTAGCAGPGEGTYLGVFQFDPNTKRVTQTASFSFAETVNGVTSIYGGASGKLVRDRREKCWWLFNSTYGSPTRVGVSFHRLDFAPLHGVHQFSNPTFIPNSRNDMDLIWDGGQYVLVYNQVSLTPYVRRAASVPDLVNAVPVSFVLSDAEGNKIRKIGSSDYIMNRYKAPVGSVVKWRCFRLTDLAYVGDMAINNATSDMEAGHPNVMEVPAAGGSKFVGISFSNQSVTARDGSVLPTSNGDLLIFESQVFSAKEMAEAGL